MIHTKIGIFFFAERSSTTKADINSRKGGIIVTVFDCFIGINFVLECYKSIIVTVTKNYILLSPNKSAGTNMSIKIFDIISKFICGKNVDYLPSITEMH